MVNSTPRHPWAGLIVFLALCFGVAASGGWVTAQSVDDWYAGLAKPSWTPPGWLFGPVWSVLYLTMAVAAWLVWRRCGLAGAALGMTLFGVQLALNALWSWLFFGLKSPGAAAVEVVLLWAAILATIVAFWRRHKPAGVLLLPYAAWVTFAAVLNLALWRLNS